MKVDGTDASGTAFTKVQDIKPVPKEKTDTKDNLTQGVNISLSSTNISNLTEYEKKELPIQEKVVIDAIEKANKSILGPNRRFEFSIHKKTKEIMVKVINSDTNEIIREIPPEKILDMVAKMWDTAGLIVDERR